MIRPRRRRFRPIVEGLDERCLMAASGLTPAQVATAYGLGGTTLGTQRGDGTGQTIAIVDAFNDPNIQAELAVVVATFQLPHPPRPRVPGPTGAPTPPAPA